MHYPAKFRTVKTFGDMAVILFSRWQPSAILILLFACLDHPTVFSGLCHCAKCVLNQSSSFYILQV